MACVTFSTDCKAKHPYSYQFQFVKQDQERYTMAILKQRRGFTIWAISLVALAFGLMTLKEGGTTLFGDEAARTAAGNYVPFVLWFNFVAGFAYVVASVGLWLQQRWAIWLAATIATATAVTFAAFGVHIYSGEAYELRTVIAMSLRTLIWVVISTVAFQALRRK
jgi:hypothetical protein